MGLFKQEELALALTALWLITICLYVSEVNGNLFKFETKHNRRLGKEDRWRRALKSAVTPDQLKGKPGEGYYLEIEMGTPKQRLNVLIDTGSSNFAVACDASLNVKKYFKMNESSSFVATGRGLSVPYTQGSWSGLLGHDLVTFPALPNHTVEANIACITQEDKFFINGSDWQGILGLAYAYIARPDSSVEPWFDTLVRGQDVNNMFSVQMCGTGSLNQDGMVNGSVLFGGLDPSQFTGELYGTPIVKERYYEVVILDIQVAGQSLNMDCKEYNVRQTIVDTGTTNLRLPDRVFDSLVDRIKQNVNISLPSRMVVDGFWQGKDFLCYTNTPVPYSDFPVVTLTLPVNQSYSLQLDITAQQYLRHVSNSEGDFVPGEECFKFGISRIQEGTVIGAIVLEGFYVIFDRLEKQISFGETTCPAADPDSRTSAVTGTTWHRQGDYMDCAYKEPDITPNQSVSVVLYVFVAISVISLVPLTILFCRRCRVCTCKKVKRKRTESETPLDDSDMNRHVHGDESER